MDIQQTQNTNDVPKDVPVATIRRRRTSGSTRDQTPDASSRTQSSAKNTDEDSSGDFYFVQPVPRTNGVSKSSSQGQVVAKILKGIEPGGHHSKILSRHNKAVAKEAHRSQSQPRKEDETQTNISTLIQAEVTPSKRSVSLPRKRDESSESERAAAVVAKLTIPAPSYKPQLTSIDSTDNKRLMQLELNLRKFEEDRRRFELERLRFIQQKRELDRMRLARFEKYKSEVLGREPHLLAPQDPFKTRVDSPMPKRSRSKSSQKVKPRRVYDYESSTVDETSDMLESEDDRKSNVNDSAVEKDSFRRTVEKEIDEQVKTSDRLDPGCEFKVRRRSASSRHRSSSRGRHSKELKGVSAPTSPAPDTPSTPLAPLATIDTEVLSDEGKEKPTEEKASTEIAKTDETIPKALEEEPKEVEDTKEKPLPKKGLKAKIVPIIRDIRTTWRQMKAAKPKEWNLIKAQIRKCFAQLLLFAIFIGLGGLAFRFLEGNYEDLYKCNTKKISRNFIDQMWLASHRLREEEWKSDARSRLKKFEEELEVAYQAGVRTYSGLTVWNFINSVMYCLNIVTTIGYGHIAPKTNTGKILTIAYAIIGIPLFLILLADFGKLLTRGIKFMWAYVRRLYYTGSCRRVRKQQQVQDVMRGLNVMYDMVRRPSMMVTNLGTVPVMTNSVNPKGPAPSTAMPTSIPTPHSPMPRPISPGSSYSRNNCESPTTLPEIEIDDDFNLPVTLALFILVAYMILGAVVYSMWEQWDFFNSFYFVFISMSTIGFGDLVPEHPMFMMASIVYLIFGLALTSMCINVVQIKLSDTFRMASAKLSATIGLQQMAETASVDAAENQTPQNTELAGVHVGHTKDGEEDNGRPKLMPRSAQISPPAVERPKNRFEFPSDKENGKSSKKSDKTKK